MKKMINIRNGVIIILCLTIVFMGIGFVVLSVELDKEKKEKKLFNVSFTSVELESSTKGDKIEPNGNVLITNKGKMLEMNFTLNTPHDELSYLITISNLGTIDAKIVDLFENPNYQETKNKNMIDPVTITHTDMDGKVIEAGGTRELRLTVYYNPSLISGKRSFNYSLGLFAESA